MGQVKQGRHKPKGLGRLGDETVVNQQQLTSEGLFCSPDALE